MDHQSFRRQFYVGVNVNGGQTTQPPQSQGKLGGGSLPSSSEPPMSDQVSQLLKTVRQMTDQLDTIEKTNVALDTNFNVRSFGSHNRTWQHINPEMLSQSMGLSRLLKLAEILGDKRERGKIPFLSLTLTLSHPFPLLMDIPQI